MQKYKIDFPNTDYSSIELPENSNLSEELDALNTPLLFGCRSGICGTCLIEVNARNNNLSTPDELEQEALDIYANNNPKARLACQINLTDDIAIKVIEQ